MGKRVEKVVFELVEGVAWKLGRFFERWKSDGSGIFGISEFFSLFAGCNKRLFACGDLTGVDNSILNNTI